MCHCCHWEYNICLASNEFVLPYEIRMWECPNPKILKKWGVYFANLTIPLALANTLNGFQGAFCFIIGAIGVSLFPKIISEDLNKRNVIQKVFCIILGIIGLVVMFY